MDKRLIICGVAVAVLLGMTPLAGAQLVIPEISAGKLTVIDQPAPALELPNATSDRTERFPEMAGGKVAVLTFMQTACSSCKQLMDRLQQVAAKRPDISVVAVAIDLGGPEVVSRYAKYFGFGGITFLADPDLKAAKTYGVSFTPGTFVVDRQGRLKAFMAGFDQGAYDELERTINGLAR